MKKLSVVGVLFAIISYILLTQLPDRKLHMVFCDVGQGDGIVLLSPENTTYLIDAGPDASILTCLGEKTPFFNRSIHTIFISHLHADHLSGAIEVVKRYGVKNISTNTIDYITPEKQELFTLIKDHKINIIESRKGQHLKLGSAIQAHIYWPKENSWNRESGNWKAYLDDFNDSSQVMTLMYDNVLFVLAGDAGAKILEEVSADPVFKEVVSKAQYRILKVSHHGSRDGDSDIFLDRLKPTVAVISAGKGNEYGHPHLETMESLQRRAIPFWRTDENGTIEFISDGRRVWSKLERKK